MFVTRLTAMVAGIAVCATPLFAQEHQHPAGERLGTVHFQTSCTPPAQEKFHHALALLHSFEFGPAIQDFTAASQADPRCAIAHWGIALARWTNPFQASIRPAAQLQQGLDAIEQARKADARTE